MPARKVGTGGISDWGPALGTIAAGAVEYLALQEPEENAGGAPAAFA
jgi:hypothetical protein